MEPARSGDIALVRSFRRAIRVLRHQCQRLEVRMEQAAIWKLWRHHRDLTDRLTELQRRIARIRAHRQRVNQRRRLLEYVHSAFRAPMVHFRRRDDTVTRRWTNVELLDRMSVTDAALRYHLRAKARSQRRVRSSAPSTPSKATARPPADDTGPSGRGLDRSAQAPRSMAAAPRTAANGLLLS